ncbi:MAG: hypothetical protein ACP6IT_04410 [Candidatus Thorarchaeota archaeon]
MADPFWANRQHAMVLSVTLGVLYLATGIWEFLSVVGIAPLVVARPDPLDSLIMFVIGSVFLTGTKLLRRNKEEGIAFPIVGLILSTIVFALGLVVLLTNALGWALGLEDWEGWMPAMNITMSMITYVGVLVVGVIMRVAKTTRRSTEEGTRQ